MYLFLRRRMKSVKVLSFLYKVYTCVFAIISASYMCICNYIQTKNGEKMTYNTMAKECNDTCTFLFAYQNMNISALSSTSHFR